MPYAKKRSYKKTKPSTKVTKATKTYVKKALTENKETNWKTVYEPEAVEQSYDVPIITKLSSVIPNPGINTREGSRIQPISLSVNFIHATAAVYNYSRVIIFQWKPDDNIEVPTQAKILEHPSSAYSITSPYVNEYVKRKKFKVLKDKMCLNQTNTTTGVSHYKFNITKFNNKFINYNNGTDDVTGKNNIYMLSFSNTAIATNGPTISGHIDLRWKDTA